MLVSIKYHRIFDYDLVKSDYPKWKYKEDKFPISNFQFPINRSEKRLKREQISNKKLIIAKKASEILSRISTVKFVGITGSLAMMNAKIDSDIDLLIITSRNNLWLTRVLVHIFLKVTGYELRASGNQNEKDKLCLNMWIDESDLIWNKKERNIYTAHEIAQVVPLVNKDNTYEKFLYLNRWILNYWPHAATIARYRDIKILSEKKTNHFISIHSISLVIEEFCFWIQYQYMKNKITREVVTSTRAVFHPNDWGKLVMEKLNSTQ